MAQFVGEIPDPNDPESVAEWARGIASLLNGQLSIGEPISQNTTMFPNGVKGHLVGSFVEVVIGQGFAPGVNYTCTHNLNVENKGIGTGPTDMNVGWIPVRWEHDGNGCAGAGIETVSCSYEGGAITANSIQLMFHAAAPRNVAQDHPSFVTLWFFPTTL